MTFNNPKELMDFLRENEGKRFKCEVIPSEVFCVYDSEYIGKGESPYRYICISECINSPMHNSFKNYCNNWYEVSQFEDRQPVYAWWGEDSLPSIKFWDAINNCSFRDYYRNGHIYENYEPVDMSTLPEKLREKILSDQAKLED